MKPVTAVIRIVFWTAVASGLVAFFWFYANYEHMAVTDSILIFTLIIDVIMIAFSVFAIYMLAEGARKGVVVVGGRYGAGVFMRATQPVRYWFGMAYYICWVLGCFYALYARNRELIPLL